jgi:hypothetical protein
MRAVMLVVAALGIVVAAVADDVVVETILTDLGRPCSIAARPGGSADRYELFIADPKGGRVLRWSNRDRDVAREAIVGLPAEETQDSGVSAPMAITLLDPGLLVVAGSSGDKPLILRAYELPDSDVVRTADKMTQSRSLGKDNRVVSGTPASFAVTRTLSNEFVRDMLVVAFQSKDGQCRLLSSRVQAGILGPLVAFTSHSSRSADSVPMGMTTSSSGRIVTVRLPAESESLRCELVFYSPLDGAVELAIPTDLESAGALAYSPITGSLYAAGSTGGVEEQGIYRIDDVSEPGRPACRCLKIAGIRGATAMAFAPDGALFVTAVEDTPPRGKLLMLTGDL